LGLSASLSFVNFVSQSDSIAKFYYLIPDLYHSALNYLRTAHFSVQGALAQINSGSEHYRILASSVLSDYDPDFLKEFLKKYPRDKAFLILPDFNLCTHVGHTRIDLSNQSFGLPPAIMKQIEKHKRAYRNRFQDMDTYRKLDRNFELNFYGFAGAEFLINHIEWDELDELDDPVFRIYPDEHPRNLISAK
jgi:hypothetical protein